MEAGTPQVVKLEDLHVAGQLSGRKHILSILVENKPGVLTRIAGLFARRGFNIVTLAVAPTDDERFSRITISVDAESAPLEQTLPDTTPPEQVPATDALQAPEEDQNDEAIVPPAAGDDGG